jgi:hypothetical protein
MKNIISNGDEIMEIKTDETGIFSEIYGSSFLIKTQQHLYQQRSLIYQMEDFYSEGRRVNILRPERFSFDELCRFIDTYYRVGFLFNDRNNADAFVASLDRDRYGIFDNLTVLKFDTENHEILDVHIEKIVTDEYTLSAVQPGESSSVIQEILGLHQRSDLYPVPGYFIRSTFGDTYTLVLRHNHDGSIVATSTVQFLKHEKNITDKNFAYFLVSAVDPEHRQKKLATYLNAKLGQYVVESLGISNIYTVIFSSNAVSYRMCKSLGLRATDDIYDVVVWHKGAERDA